MTHNTTALRSRWRKAAFQKAAQAWRFARLFLIALAGQVGAQLTANGFDLDRVTHVDQKAVVALVIGALEVVWRQVHPAITASVVTDAAEPSVVPGDTGGV